MNSRARVIDFLASHRQTSEQGRRQPDAPAAAYLQVIANRRRARRARR